MFHDFKTHFLVIMVNILSYLSTFCFYIFVNNNYQWRSQGVEGVQTHSPPKYQNFYFFIYSANESTQNKNTFCGSRFTGKFLTGQHATS